MVPIFKTGRHTSMNGYEKEWTESDLDRIASTYNSQPAESRHDAPAVIGHPKTDGPAFGFFNRLERKGGLLYGELRDAKDEFVQWVRDGHYRKVSPKLDHNLLLKHVGWLGATPPAVKGLPEFAFSEEGEGEAWDVEFSESDIDDKTITSRTADGDMKLETQKAGGDPVEPVNAGGAGTQAAAAGGVVGSGTQGGSQDPAQTATAGGVSVAEFAEFKQKHEREQETLRAQLAEQKRKNRELEFAEYLNRDELRGRITPAMKPRVTRLMHTLADSGVVHEFAEEDADGQAQTVKKDPLSEFKELLGTLPVSVELSEIAIVGRTQTGTAEFAEADTKELDELVSGSLGGVA